MGSNKLYIENTNSATALIGGDFSTDEVVINGKLGIGVSSPDEEIHVKGSSFERIKVESTGSGATASIVLQSIAGFNDNFSIEKFGPTSPATTAGGIPLAGVSRISSGVDSGPLVLQVVTSNTPMLFATGDALQMTLESTGNLKLEQKLTAPDTPDADMKAYIYGSLTSGGLASVNGGSSGGYESSKLATGNYFIQFNNSPDNKLYTVITSMRFNDIGFITVQNGTTSFTVKTYNTSGVATDKAFNFVVYKQ